MSGDAQVADEVVERLARLTYMGCSPRSGADWQYALDDARAIVAHLRANPVDAAAVLGGFVEDSSECGYQGAVPDYVWTHRHRVAGPWLPARTEGPTP